MKSFFDRIIKSNHLSNVINLILFKKTIIVILFIFSLSCNNKVEEISNNDSSLSTETVEVYLINNLNESRGYCVDMMGYKENADVNRPLQAHSCYSYQGGISVDQGFDKSKIINEEFFIRHFKICMEAEKLEQSSSLNLNTCDKNQRQKFILDSDGKIQPKGDLSLCLTVSEDYREGGGGNPVHLIRTLTLEKCNESLSPFQKWGIRKTN